MSAEHPDLARLAAARPSRAAEAISRLGDPAVVVALVPTAIWWSATSAARR